MRCDMCNSEVSATSIEKNKFYCSTCFIKQNPPLLLIAKKWNSDIFFLVERNISFSNIHTIEKLKYCGFVLHRSETFFNTKINKRYEHVYTLRYFGNTCCNLINHYNWPPTMEMCPHKHCP